MLVLKYIGRHIKINCNFCATIKICMHVFLNLQNIFTKIVYCCVFYKQNKEKNKFTVSEKKIVEHITEMGSLQFWWNT